MVLETDSYIIWQTVRIFGLGFLSFLLSLAIIPKFTDFIYKHQLWRKKDKDKSIDGKKLEVFSKFHGGEGTRIPRVGGIIIWAIPLLVALIFLILSKFDIGLTGQINFVNRAQTWLPIFALFSASVLGLVDDLLQIRGKGKYIGGGLKLSWRIGLIGLIGLIGGWWFYFKLGVTTIGIPGIGSIFVGWWLIPIFIITMLGVYSGGIIDGLDGLAGGTFSIIFGAFAIIAFLNLQYDLAAFCLVLVGALLAFLWFNIPPARFYLGETVMGLCATLTVIAFFTDSLFVLPIIGFLLVLESGSVIIQLLHKKIYGRKLFLAAPIHHHFEAKGWPHYKVTMRFWVIGLVMALIGVAIRLLW